VWNGQLWCEAGQPTHSNITWVILSVWVAGKMYNAHIAKSSLIAAIFWSRVLLARSFLQVVEEPERGIKKEKQPKTKLQMIWARQVRQGQAWIKQMLNAHQLVKFEQACETRLTLRTSRLQPCQAICWLKASHLFKIKGRRINLKTSFLPFPTKRLNNVSDKSFD
jgi:hypothetical protein